jgi:forkhead box protein J1
MTDPQQNLLNSSLSSLSWLAEMRGGIMQQCENAEPDLLEIVRDTSRPITPEEEEALLDIDWESHPNLKPPFAYATLIYMALRDTDKEKLALSEIYEYIMNDFAYYRDCDPGWKNSVRHNLTQEPCFQKVERDPGDRGKGGYWRLNPDFNDHDILAAKRRRKFRKKRANGNTKQRTCSGNSDSSVGMWTEVKNGKLNRSNSSTSAKQKASSSSTKQTKASKSTSSPKMRLRRQKALRDASQCILPTDTKVQQQTSTSHVLNASRRDSGVKSPIISPKSSLVSLGGFTNSDSLVNVRLPPSRDDGRMFGSFDSGIFSPPPFITF